MVALPETVAELIASVLSGEFADSSVDLHELDRIRSGQFDKWLDQLRESWLFAETEIAMVRAAWRRDPELLVAALLDGVDELTLRRMRVATVVHHTAVAAV